MQANTPHPQDATTDGDRAATVLETEPQGGTRRRSVTVRRWVARVISLVSTLAVVGIVGLALALTAVPAAVGGHALTVLSGSMVPEFSSGAMVVDKPASASSLRVGDVITYASTDEVSGAPILITHRIVEIQSGAARPTFITQGDANNSPDSRPVEADQIRGKVWYSVPYIGTARNFLLADGAGLILGGATGLTVAVWFLLRLLRSPEPLPNVTASAASPTRGVRHQAGKTTMATAVLGMLLIAGHPVTDRQGTYAHFSDHQILRFQITVETAASSE
jgi:signal peptidase